MIFRFFRFQKTSQGFFLPRRNKNILVIPPHRCAETIQNLLLNPALVIDALYLLAFLCADDTEGRHISPIRSAREILQKINHKQTFPIHHRLLYRYLPAHSAFLVKRGKRHCLYLFQIHALASLQEIFQTDANALFRLFRRCLRICR